MASRDPLTGTALPLALSPNGRTTPVKAVTIRRLAVRVGSTAALSADQFKFRVLEALCSAGDSGLSAADIAHAFPAEKRKRICNALEAIRHRRFAVSCGRGPGAMTKISEAGKSVLAAHKDAGIFSALPDIDQLCR